jgi:hypothetical protein
MGYQMKVGGGVLSVVSAALETVEAAAGTPRYVETLAQEVDSEAVASMARR